MKLHQFTMIHKTTVAWRTWPTNNSQNNVEKYSKETIPKRFMIDIALHSFWICFILSQNNGCWTIFIEMHLSASRELIHMVVSLFSKRTEKARERGMKKKRGKTIKINVCFIFRKFQINSVQLHKMPLQITNAEMIESSLWLVWLNLCFLSQFASNPNQRFEMELHMWTEDSTPSHNLQIKTRTINVTFMMNPRHLVGGKCVHVRERERERGGR